MTEIIEKPSIKPRKSRLCDRTVRRVIEPYLKLSRKEKLEVSKLETNTYFLKKQSAFLLKDLSSFLSHSAELISILHETALVMKNIIQADGYNIYIVDNDTNELRLCMRKDVLDKYKIHWQIREGSVISAYVAARKQYIMVDNVATSDNRFPMGIGGFQSVDVGPIMCVPVVTLDLECFAVLEFFKRNTESPFGTEDLKMVIVVTGWMGTAIHQNRQRLKLQKQQELNDRLLELTKCYFADTSLMEQMITEIVKFAKSTLGAERGSFFIIDRSFDTNDLTADMYDEGLETDRMYKKSLKVKLENKGITGLVAKTGQTINIKNAQEDTRFNKELDKKTGYITKAILCMPIMGVDGILGVFQLINKKNGGFFDSNDENIFKTFSIYCALALHYTNVHTQMKKTIHLNNCYSKLLQLQLKPCIHDFEEVLNNVNLPVPNGFYNFTWYINDENYHNMPQLVLHMFLKIIGGTSLNMEDTIRFILEAKKFYRDNPYHNFEHAFNVAHCMFNTLRLNILTFSKLEIKALLVSALCHDLDHPGFTNNFLQVVKDDLAQLYEESILENHHYFVTLQLLNDCKIFPDMKHEEYPLFLKEIKDAIIATDLMLHFKCRAKLGQIINENLFDFSNTNHMTLLKSVMMTSADLSGQCKPFLVAKKLADAIYKEFYNQGDIEKSMNKIPLSIMDREKVQMVPEDQIQFLTVIVIPCVDLMKTLLPNTEELYNEACQLRKTWQQIIEMRNKKLSKKGEEY